MRAVPELTSETAALQFAFASRAALWRVASLYTIFSLKSCLLRQCLGGPVDSLCFKPFIKGAGLTFLLRNSFNLSNSLPFLHLLWKRALRAIGVVLHAKVLVNLKQALLVHDSLQELFSTRIVSEKTGRSCFKSSI
jgi:hypothetical protein